MTTTAPPRPASAPRTVAGQMTARPPRRRPRRGIGAGAAVLAVAAVWWFGAPALVALGQAVPVRVDDAPAVTLPELDVDGATVVGYEDGAYATLSIPVTNAGPVGVTVTGVRLSDTPLRLATPVDEGGGLPRAMGPGETVTVPLQVRFDHCDYYHERELDLYPAAFVDLEVLGRSLTREVAFAHQLIVHSPMLVGCPDRLLDRQARDRTDATRR